jgi:TPR repeat protein
MRRKLFKILVCLCALIIGTSATFAQDGQSKAIALCHEADSILDAAYRSYKYDDSSVISIETGFELNAQALVQPGIDFDLYQTIMEHRRYYCSLLKWQKESEKDVGNYDYMMDNRDNFYYFKVKTDYFKVKAEAGDTYAMISLANLYIKMARYERREMNVPNPKKPGKTQKEQVTDWFAPDGEIATERYMYWMKKAIELGNRTAMFTLGRVYVETDTAEDYVTKEMSDLFPKRMISNNPVFSEATFANGLKLIEQAAEKGNFFAIHRLAAIYGAGTDKDKYVQYRQKTLESAKENGYYGYIILEADEFHDYKESMELFEETVKATNSKYAMKRIGDLYFNGAGVQQDINTAKEWYKKAGNDDAIRCCDAVLDEQKHGKRVDLPVSIERQYGALYKKNGNLVNADGKIIIPANKYEKVLFDDNVIIVKKNGKFGAVTYKGTPIVAPIYQKYSGSGTKENRIMFTNTTTNGVKHFIFSLKGRLVASRAFTNSQQYARACWIRDWLEYLANPLYIRGD